MTAAELTSAGTGQAIILMALVTVGCLLAAIADHLKEERDRMRRKEQK